MQTIYRKEFVKVPRVSPRFGPSFDGVLRARFVCQSRANCLFFLGEQPSCGGVVPLTELKKVSSTYYGVCKQWQFFQERPTLKSPSSAYIEFSAVLWRQYGGQHCAELQWKSKIEGFARIRQNYRLLMRHYTRKRPHVVMTNTTETDKRAHLIIDDVVAAFHNKTYNKDGLCISDDLQARK